MIQRRFEITVIDGISDAEMEWFKSNIPTSHEAVLSKSRGILVLSGPETIYEAIELLAKNEFVYDIGLIKEIVEYEPEFDSSEMLIEWSPE